MAACCLNRRQECWRSRMSATRKARSGGRRNSGLPRRNRRFVWPRAVYCTAPAEKAWRQDAEDGCPRATESCGWARRRAAKAIAWASVGTVGGVRLGTEVCCGAEGRWGAEVRWGALGCWTTGTARLRCRSSCSRCSSLSIAESSGDAFSTTTVAATAGSAAAEAGARLTDIWDLCSF